MKMKYSKLLILLVLVSACTQTEIKELFVTSHNTVYTFSYDVREALKVPVENSDQIIRTFAENSEITLVFNGTSGSDNAIFAVTSFNIVSNVGQYFKNEGIPVYFDVKYFVNDTWYNKTGPHDPDLSGTVIWLKGPATGAQRTAVYMNNGHIFVEGTDSKNVILAGDRLFLLLIGINKFEDIGNR